MPAPEQIVAPSLVASASQPKLLVCLPPMSSEAKQAALETVNEAFSGRSYAVGMVDAESGKPAYADPRTQTGWSLAATDYVAAANLARTQEAGHVLLLGTDAPCLEVLTSLANGLSTSADVVVPRLHPGPKDGLVNSGLLYPLTTALFGQDIRFPLPYNIALSTRAIERLATAARQDVAAGNPNALVWPISVAAGAGFTVREAETGEPLPVPLIPDFNRLFTEVIGSLFVDLEEHAIVWQRFRPSVAVVPATMPLPAAAGDDAVQVAQMVEGFRLASGNMLPIWSFVLPPQTLLALKKLAQTPPSSFVFPARLWARVVYDFALAFRLRTLNRNHAVGAMTQLYLAWAASHIRQTAGDPARAEFLIRDVAEAFKTEKPYFVARWRWPDRFNP